MPSDSPPNILLILTDQQRLSAAGCYGPTVCQTPHVDQLANEGVHFERAYTTCPVCSPTRASIMTGLYPFAHGICANVENLGCSVQSLADGPQLLPRRLEQAGYQLGYSGKWHLCAEQDELFGQPSPTCLPRDTGFTGHDFPGQGQGGYAYESYRAYARELGCEDALRLEHDKATGVQFGEWTGPEEGTVDHFLTQHTIDMMDHFDRSDRPFFVWHNFWGPHAPHVAPTAYLDRYRDIEIEPWPNFDWPSRETPGPHQLKIAPGHDGSEWPLWQEKIRHYYAFTTYIDDQIGRMLESMRTSGLLEKTVILFASDHGETLGSHGGLTDKGFTHFEEVQRVPLIIRFPDGRWAGTTRQEFASLIDLYPTICDLASAPLPAVVHGQSLLDLVEHRGGWRESVVVEFDGLNGSSCTMRTLREASLKYGYTCGGRDELYDLANDPHETDNLIDRPEYRDRLSHLQAQLRRWMLDHGDPALARMQNKLTATRGVN